jgi:hypothetical protein
VRTQGGWRVEDANGTAVAYCYGRDDATGVGYNGLTVDEARRIAANIAKLPDLLQSVGVSPSRRKRSVDKQSELQEEANS